MRRGGIMKLGIGVAILICVTFSIPSYAAEIQEVVTSVTQTYQISTRAEQTTWVERVYKGVKQKRLWSRTYNCWRSDWIIVRR